MPPRSPRQETFVPKPYHRIYAELFDAAAVAHAPELARYPGMLVQALEDGAGAELLRTILSFGGLDTSVAIREKRDPAICACVEILLEAGLNVNVECVTPERTALHTAFAYSLPRTAALLLARGAAVDVRDGLGLTPVQIAAELGHTDLVRLCAAHGARDAAAHQLQRLLPTPG